MNYYMPINKGNLWWLSLLLNFKMLMVHAFLLFSHRIKMLFPLITDKIRFHGPRRFQEFEPWLYKRQKWIYNMEAFELSSLKLVSPLMKVQWPLLHAKKFHRFLFTYSPLALLTLYFSCHFRATAQKAGRYVVLQSQVSTHTHLIE